MIRSEETATIEQGPMEPTERVRLRKVLVTEDVEKTVPLRREIIQLETDPPPAGTIESSEDLDGAPRGRRGAAPAGLSGRRSPALAGRARGGRDRQLVGALVELRADVAADPVPAHAGQPPGLGLQRLPQLLVLDGIAARRSSSRASSSPPATTSSRRAGSASR
jgi:hypothetical protein